MELNAQAKVGEIVSDNFRTARIFEEFGIDFCCGGNISIEEACVRSEVDLQTLLPKLEELVNLSDPDSSYINSLDLDELCDYIERRHHSYVREHIHFIEQKLQKLCEVHGDHHPELFEVRELFNGAALNLSRHMQKEEEELFPYISQLTIQKNEGNGTTQAGGKILPTIGELEDEHQVEGERFRKISYITSSYNTPADGCHTYRVCYQELGEFEKDLHRHIHLENNILFIKAMKMEQEIMGR